MNVLIATCANRKEGKRQYGSNPAYPLMTYLKNRVDHLAVIEQPLPGTQGDLIPTIDIYEEGKLKLTYQVPKLLRFYSDIPPEKQIPKTYFRLKIRDVFSLVYFYFKNQKNKYDLFVGVEAVNAIVGGFLKDIGVVKQVVYYISDYSPLKYANKWINKFYLWLDKKACLSADFIWNYTYTIAEARKELGFDEKKMGKQFTVPFGFDNQDICYPEVKDIDKKQLIYCGGMGPDNGVSLLIEAMPLIVNKIPDIKLTVLGTGIEEAELRKRADELKIGEYIKWEGYISDQKKKIEYLLSSSVGIAPFAPLKTSAKIYGDVIKIREYIGCGLPVVTTAVPPSSQEVKEERLGIVIEYTKESLCGAVTKLIEDESFYSQIRKNILHKAESQKWENIYKRTFSQMGIELFKAEEGERA